VCVWDCVKRVCEKSKAFQREIGRKRVVDCAVFCDWTYYCDVSAETDTRCEELGKHDIGEIKVMGIR